ncbi:MAPEG family protein [Pseudoblastomonas halimionae]|uniref:MAPEG family protein n=1 Tax=Alteriqipengyuania halimionae TaxID=1926630 RepID=A0A6I4U4C5_9SPHN|nr:MAPEG family protein [Alteriqipengyuania halimionae]MXP09281.1 MAPEG family protein [Alteriqipengyuania halimionae]
MIGMGILQPVVALAAWTMVMWFWMYLARIPAMNAAGIEPDDARDTAEMGRQLPPEAQWKTHNYNHLHEAPTVFYAVAIVLAIIGAGDGMAMWLGWAYVGLRVLHSLVQATINRVMVRFALYSLSMVVLLALVFIGGIAVFDIPLGPRPF